MRRGKLELALLRVELLALRWTRTGAEGDETENADEVANNDRTAATRRLIRAMLQVVDGIVGWWMMLTTGLTTENMTATRLHAFS
jgi:hypothetical protein